MKNIIKLSLIAISFIFYSCEDYLEKYPLEGPSSETYLRNEKELLDVLFGIYSLNSNDLRDGMSMTLLLDGTTDIYFERGTSGIQQLGNGNYDGRSGIAIDVWKNAYKVIGRCNFLLDNMYKAEGNVSSAKMKAIAAEARFVRAYTYHYLIELYGDVPLVTKMINLEEAMMPRTQKAIIVDFILDELEAIKNDFDPSYNGKGRASKAAALAIKARTALYNKKWDVAETASKEVMDMGKHTLHPNFGELFLYTGQNSSETIWSHQYLRSAKKFMNATGIFSRNAGGYSSKVPTQSLVDAYLCSDGLPIDLSSSYNPAKPFENRDPRLSQTIALPGSVFLGYQFETHGDSINCWNYNVTPAQRIVNNNQDAKNEFATFTGYCWRKYADSQDLGIATNSELNAIIIRYAEILLIYAEAKIEQGEVDQTVYNALNAIRQRPTVNMPAVPTDLSDTELLELVYRERLYELAMEGFRLFDIRRWGIAEDVLNGPLYGRIKYGLLSNAPKIDKYAVPNYSNVPNRADMRQIEQRVFDPAKNYLWPIPEAERTTNPALTQNPGY